MYTSAFAFLGATISYLVGGFNEPFITLLIFMITDYITGVALSVFFKKSPKTETGAYSSRYGIIGIIKKVMLLFLVMIATRLDITIHADYFRDTTIFAICANELVSIIENIGLCGVPVPDIIKSAIDILRKEEKDNE